VTQVGYARADTRPAVARDGADFVAYPQQSLPPVEFEYSQPVVRDTVNEVEPATLPCGLNGQVDQWVDLHGEGISGAAAAPDTGTSCSRWPPSPCSP